MRTIGPIVVLLALWLLLSGIYEPLIIGFGVVSVLIAVLVVWRMDAVDGDHLEVRLHPLGLLGYLGWLMIEIAKANWAVTKIVCARNMPIRQHLFSIPVSQRTDLGQVIFANSITLTPGTISVETEEGCFLVHAVAFSQDDYAALDDMDRRVTAVELEQRS